jgi:Dockerin type I domain
VLDGNRQFRLVATNMGGSATSNPANLSLVPHLEQKLVNPDFEMTPVGTNWTVSDPGIIGPFTTVNAHEGNNSLYLGYWAAIYTDWAYQEVAIPAAPTGVELSFWLKIINDVGVPASVVNTITVKLQATSGVDLATLGTLDNTTSGFASFAKVGPFDVKAFAGQTVRVFLTSTQSDAAFNTSFFVDDVNLIVNTTPPGPSFDINGDGVTDAYDLLELLKRYGSTSSADLAKADFNSDGQIDDADLTALLSAL